MQWVGVAFMFAVATVVATSSGYRVFAVVFGALVLFVLFGHLWEHRKRRSLK